MPSYNWQLDDVQVAAVLTYIRNSWGNEASAVPTGEITKTRKNLDKRADYLEGGDLVGEGLLVGAATTSHM